MTLSEYLNKLSINNNCCILVIVDDKSAIIHSGYGFNPDKNGLGYDDTRIVKNVTIESRIISEKPDIRIEIEVE